MIQVTVKSVPKGEIQREKSPQCWGSFTDDMTFETVAKGRGRGSLPWGRHVSQMWSPRVGGGKQEAWAVRE